MAQQRARIVGIFTSLTIRAAMQGPPLRHGTVDENKSGRNLKDSLNYGNYGISLIMGNAGFRSSAVCVFFWTLHLRRQSAPSDCTRNLITLSSNSGYFNIKQRSVGVQGLGFRVYHLGGEATLYLIVEPENVASNPETQTLNYPKP